MARLISQASCVSTQLTQHWLCLTTPPHPAGTPACAAAASRWIPAPVPGTVAAARLAADPAAPLSDLSAQDHWYRLDMDFPAASSLECDGLATVAEIWLDGHLVATSHTMFHPLTVPVPASGAHRLELCFRALRPILRPTLRQRASGRRPRWRGRLAEPEALRSHRTTLLGHMPGWSADTPIIGPFRPITLHVPVPDAPIVDRVDLSTSLRPDGAGLIRLRLIGAGLAHRPGSLAAAGHRISLSPDDAGLRGELVIPNPPLWWPHTHGDPALLAVTADIDGVSLDLGQIGFRTIARRDPAAGFGLRVNDVPVFCRGAIWTGVDTPEAGLPAALHRARDAGFNMLRVTGMTLYETPAFFSLCDALGIMVWHDFMFARFDYPDDPTFLDTARAEARAFLQATQSHPSLAVLCGGTEIAQAAAMAGCPPATWHMPLFEDVLARQAAEIRPDIPYAPHSPMPAPDGALPFAASAPIAHYFGVGAYLRPLQDLAEARVGFAAECLAFANPPDPATYRAHADTQPAHLGVPRDIDASWDFADVRDHYVEHLFGTPAAALRRQDPLAWLALGRAAVAILMQQVIGTWRTDGRCGGALVLMLQDIVPGAGWGVVGQDGRPKSAWYALRSVSRPLQVLLRDLGQNGVVLHAINETATPRTVRLGLRGLTPEGDEQSLGSAVLDLAPRQSRAIPALSLMGRWRDLAHAWQFGPPAFTVLGATLDDAANGSRLSESTHFPTGPALPRSRPGLTASLRDDAGTWALHVSASGFAQFVAVDDDDYVAADNYFHLWPGESRLLPLHRIGSRSQPPSGSVGALNAATDVHYRRAA